jgi:hypothetical protein
MQRWREWDDARDEIIMDAIAAGMKPAEIHHVMGVSRAHIYRLLRREQSQCQQKTA